MTDWIILNQPICLVLYGAALFFCLFERAHPSVGGWFIYISGGLAILSTALLLLAGACFFEAASMLAVFLLLNMGVKE